jgi:protein-L-isoaspartate(D-aspartate) O-methyltransferase
MDNERAEERISMVRNQIRARGIKNQAVLQAMETMPRHLFVPAALSGQAYQDYPLPIGHGQTISQPYIVALMTEFLDPHPGDRILEIGTGSGYQAAVIATMGAAVTSIERIAAVADQARTNLKRTAIRGVRVIEGDGTEGWPEDAPYDGILITAASPAIPGPLIAQLKEGGHLIAPVGTLQVQDLVKLVKRQGEIITEPISSVRFVPLLGRYGWNEKNYEPFT